MKITLIFFCRVSKSDPGANPDFLSLKEARKAVAKAASMAEADLELSMGMSGDFEEAVATGSTSVRVGSGVFGARSYPQKKDEDKTVEQKMAETKIS